LNENLLESVIANPPQAHQGDTEVGIEKALTGSSLAGSSLAGYMRQVIEKNLVLCHGIDSKVARFLYRAITEGARTLETGSGLSTVIFAMRKSHHTVVTPSPGEAAVIREYAREKQIDMGRVEFVLEPSETYLPRCTVRDIDLVLIDGKHSVPWPFIDWFYTADKLKVGGTCVIDDVHLESVLMLVKFLREEPRWEFIWELPRRTIAFRKVSATIHDVAWHQQPYISRRYGRKARVLNALGIKWRPKPKE
jgi:predicted O-methyltransferase YrrM